MKLNYLEGFYEVGYMWVYIFNVEIVFGFDKKVIILFDVVMIMIIEIYIIVVGKVFYDFNIFSIFVFIFVEN